MTNETVTINWWVVGGLALCVASGVVSMWGLVALFGWINSLLE